MNTIKIYFKSPDSQHGIFRDIRCHLFHIDTAHFTATATTASAAQSSWTHGKQRRKARTAELILPPERKCAVVLITSIPQMSLRPSLKEESVIFPVVFGLKLFGSLQLAQAQSVLVERSGHRSAVGSCIVKSCYEVGHSPQVLRLKFNHLMTEGSGQNRKTE